VSDEAGQVGARAAAAETQANEERLRLALRAGGLGVWQWDLETGATEWDPALEALFGLLPGTFGGTLDEWAERIHPDDRGRVLTTVAAATEANVDYRVVHRVVWPDGTVRWVEGLARPVVAEGRVTGYLGVTSDVTDRREAEAEREALLKRESAARSLAEAATERVEFLSSVTSWLAATLDLDERLRRLAQVGVPRLADVAAIHVRDGEEIRLAGAHHDDPEMARRFARYSERWPVRADAAEGVGAVIREGLPRFYASITDELLTGFAQDPEHLAELRDLRSSSQLTVPIRGRDRPVGAVTFLCLGDREMGERDIALATDLVAQAGILVENGLLIAARERDRQEQRFQAALLGALFKASVDGILVVDPDGRVLSRNDRFAEVWGFDAEAARTEDDDHLLALAVERVRDPEAFIDRVRSLYADPTTTAHDEVLLADGRVLDRYGAPLHADGGSYLGWAWTFRDVSVERAHQAEIAAAGERFAAVARTLQQSLLPPRLPAPDGMDLAARYHPALEGIEVGGDFYDVFAAGTGWCIVLGDVCGKGPEAARVTGLVRWTLRAAAMRNEDPAAVLTELNTVMLSNHPDEGLDARFATVCCLWATAKPEGGLTVRISSAGHPVPIIRRADGTFEVLDLVGNPVGLFADIEFASMSVDLAVGDGIIVVTDGVLESRDERGRELDIDGVLAAIEDADVPTAAGVSEAIEARALAHQGGVARDDIAVLVAIAAPLDGG
jgi:PAS domain S-box-containing protein